MGTSFAPLAVPAFRLLVSAETISAVGTAIAPVALVFAVRDLGASTTALGLVVAARSLANVVFLLLGGVVADRLPRHVVLVGSSAAAGLTQAAVAGLVLAGAASLPSLALLSAVNGAVSAFALPASAALLPQTVAEPLRRQANALARLGLNTAQVAGASLAGVLVALAGPGWGIAVDAASFLVAGALFARVRVPAAERTAERGEPLRTALAVGWREVVSRRWLWVVVAGFLVLNAVGVGAYGVLGPVVADRSFGRAAWGAVVAAETVGLVAGGLIAVRLRVRRALRLGVVMFAGCGAVLFGLGLTSSVPVLVALSFIGGIGIEQFEVAWSTTLQHHVPADRLARVASIDLLGSFLAIPLGQVAIGPVADAVGVHVALVGAGVVVVLCVAAMLAVRSVREVAVPTG